MAQVADQSIVLIVYHPAEQIQTWFPIIPILQMKNKLEIH